MSHVYNPLGNIRKIIAFEHSHFNKYYFIDISEASINTLKPSRSRGLVYGVGMWIDMSR